MTTPLRGAFLLALGCGLAACSKDQQQQTTQTSVTGRAPDTVRVRFETSKGSFTVEAYHDWAPRGVDRFYELVQQGYFDRIRFFRVLPGFMAQFGISGDPKVNAAWRDKTIADDSVTHSNKRGTISFATRGPNTRTTQLFINYADNDQLDGMGFTPIGVVKDGMAVVDNLYSGYGEGFPRGNGPDQERMNAEGNIYMKNNFPKLDSIVKTTLIKR